MAFLNPLYGARHGVFHKCTAWCARIAPLALVHAILALPLPCTAEDALFTNKEKELKVAFLYNFALYTQWPMPLNDGLTLCVLGRDDLGSTLDALASRQISGKPLILRRLDARADLAGCHMIYISAASEAKALSAPLDLLQKPILSVKDAASADYATISLGRDGNRLVFDINNTNAQAVGLTLSSKLLRLARSVR